MQKRKASIKTEQDKFLSIDEPINSETWKCAVVMAVERSPLDTFVLKFFTEEAVKGLRQDVKHIDLDSFVLKILHDFANGELPFKYMYLLNFQSVFQEAAEYVKSKVDIPVPLLVKVIKALLFYLRHESMSRIEKKAQGLREPIQAMAERPTFLGESETKAKQNEQKEIPKGKEKGGKLKEKVISNEGGLKVRPPSTIKLETTLMKRGESAGDSQCIDDAPAEGYFQLYVLLTGFYDPEFPMEVLKAQIPLHGLICIDTSLSGVKRVSDSGVLRLKKKSGEEKVLEVQRFWDTFLKTLWNPNTSRIFRDTIFQVYVPRMLLCGEKQLKEFIYREISYLMYDLSDFKTQLDIYLKNMKLWNVSANDDDYIDEDEKEDELSELRCECITVPVVLQRVLNLICGYDDFVSSYSTESDTTSVVSVKDENLLSESAYSDSILGKYGSFAPTPVISQIIDYNADYNKAVISAKIKELDIWYGLDDRSYFYTPLGKLFTDFYEEDFCKYRKIGGVGENMEAALNTENGVFGLYWKNHPKKRETFSFTWDYCLCALLACRVLCPYELPPPFPSVKSSRIFKRNSTIELIENMETEMYKPHFSVTEGSRSILKSFPYNLIETNKNFFCCQEYKVVTPKKLKVSSAPEFLTSPKLYPHFSYFSELLNNKQIFEKCEFNVYQNIRDFLGEEVFENVNGFYFVEELSKPKLLSREDEYWDSYNCIDCNFSVLLDSIFVVLHNRSDGENTHHETFNETLRTVVGLRDFYEYILEDEAEWFKAYEKSYKSNLTILAQKSIQEEMFKNVTESDFLLENSIKYQEYMKNTTPPLKDSKQSKKEGSKTGGDKSLRKDAVGEAKETMSMHSKYSRQNGLFDFVGYNVEDIAVQFSGLKTLYCVEDCRLSVQLLERLYGDQCLGVHVHQGGHNLHLYSYACPVPHIRHPYTFNLMYKNGIIITFGKRYNDVIIEVEDTGESKGSFRSKVYSHSSGISEKPMRKIHSIEEDTDFLYDLSLSLPNGLMIKTVKRIVNPCYIKQLYLVRNNKYSETVQKENCRLFLPDGTVIKMMENKTVQILKADTTIVTADLSDLVKETILTPENETKFILDLKNYDIITPSGFQYVVNDGKISSSKRHPIFKKSELQTNTTFYRRKDGTNYMEQGSGTNCMQFTDNTKISKTVFVEDFSSDAHYYYDFGEESVFESESEETVDDEDFEREFVMVYTEVIIEHPDYATVKFNSQTRVWNVVLPFESKITISPNGNYFVEIDKQTELKIDQDLVEMTRYKAEDPKELYCKVSADLQVFKTKGNMYCKMRDGLGKVFVVEPNANCYSYIDEGIKELSTDLLNSKSVATKTAEPSTTKSIDASKTVAASKTEAISTTEAPSKTAAISRTAAVSKTATSQVSKYTTLAKNTAVSKYTIDSRSTALSKSVALSTKTGATTPRTGLSSTLTINEMSVKKDLESSQSEYVNEDNFMNEIFYGTSTKYDNPGKKLVRENKYLIVKRDVTGYEIMHQVDVEMLFMKAEEGSVVYIQDLPDMDYVRCFILLQPADTAKKKSHKWAVESTLPDPKYFAGSTNATTSSTYGDPPSWIHPFINKPKKLAIPESLTCRVFIETKRTRIRVPLIKTGAYDNIAFPEPKYTIIKPGSENVQTYLKKLASNDQNILKEMYLLAIKRKKTDSLLKSENLEKSLYSDKLKHYLELAKYYNEMEEYYKHCIRYNIIPNYFQHPLGMSWLILNSNLDELQLPDKEKDSAKLVKPKVPLSERTLSEFSYEEIEYNLFSESSKSYSDLSYRSGLSAKTAPTVLNTINEESLIYKVEKKSKSSPNILLHETRKNEEEREMEIYEKHPTCCFGLSELEKLQTEKKMDSADMTVNDLMALGLI